MIVLKISNFLILEGVRYNFCHICLVHPDVFENFFEIWVENAPV